MNHLELMKTAALNEIAIGTTVNSIQQLKSHLNQLIQTGRKIRLSLPKKWRKKTYVTPIGEIKYSNILLWCDGTDDLDLSTMHLQVRVLNCLAILSKIRMLLAKKCFD